jgi:hypothetical protein
METGYNSDHLHRGKDLLPTENNRPKKITLKYHILVIFNFYLKWRFCNEAETRELLFFIFVFLKVCCCCCIVPSILGPNIFSKINKQTNKK